MPTNEIAFYYDFSSPKLDSTKWNVYTAGQVFNQGLQGYTIKMKG